MDQRIRRHNTNHNDFKGHAGDWTLQYIEHFATEETARKREREIKAWKSRKNQRLIHRGTTVI